LAALHIGGFAIGRRRREYVLSLPGIRCDDQHLPGNSHLRLPGM